MIATMSRLVFASVLLALPTKISAAEEESHCFPIATLKISFQVVFPNARQITMEGDAARAYLKEYNSFGHPTKFTGILCS